LAVRVTESSFVVAATVILTPQNLSRLRNRAGHRRVKALERSAEFDAVRLFFF
jgi:hypothetical protein